MSEYILGLDIGSNKIRALIAKNDGELSISGVGVADTLGIKKGVITNIEQAASSIKQAVKGAIKSAGRNYDRAVVSISGSYAKSVKSRGVITMEREIGIHEIDRAMKVAQAQANVPNDYTILHVLPYDFKIDEQEHIEDPLGMSGSRLEVSVHIIIAPKSSIQNLKKSVEMAGVKVSNIVLSGYASSISTLTKDEKELGVVLIDMGGATCDVVIHLGNSLRYNDVVMLGSNNITNDLSRALHTPLPYAENIKITYNDLINEGDSEVNLPIMGEREDESKLISLEIISQVILARVKEIFDLLADKIDKSGYKDRLGAGVVITGGMAKLDDVRDLGTMVFDNISVRVARPKSVSGLSEISYDSANACAVGLCMYGFGDFTPYEIDSNGELRYKDETIKISTSRESSTYYEKEVTQAIETEEVKSSVTNTNTMANNGGLGIGLPEKKKPNMFEKFMTMIKNSF
ncbi:MULTISPECIES: cell division protein FtsA [unclassified Campylobacter]|uniref:cell division protein FtsA n=1 Tax=unclassified Campylobacter TaxID=2593542 RepID=UPI0022E99CF5|nr:MULTISPECIES: cell division protein FtsA [unclassified Campylobacter]MDA3062397.1 cell division protein FtsA [Campylobacter sp. JMF_14 EL1]MDA3073484.1 cell division protein FtsA [Campylobacter sp. JMF_10 EL2]MDA3077511.1 cell division protein FtsA [Campylobacter sp. JMF_06 NA1]